jgi:hypothetical protein
MKKWEPNHENFAKVVHRIHDGQHFGGYNQHLFINAQLIGIAKKIILDTCVLKSE